METAKVAESKEKEGFLVQFHWPRRPRGKRSRKVPDAKALARPRPIMATFDYGGHAWLTNYSLGKAAR